MSLAPKRAVLWRRQVEDTAVLGLVDGVAWVGALVGGDLLARLFFGGRVSLQYSLLMIPLWWIGAGAIRLYPGWGTGVVEEVRRQELMLVASFGLASLVSFLTRMGSRASFLFAFLVAAILFPLARQAAKSLLIRAGAWGVPAVIHGDEASAASIVRALRAEPGLGYVPVGVVTGEASAPVRAVEGVPVLDSAIAGHPPAPVALLASAQMGGAAVMEYVEHRLREFPTVVLVPELADAPSLWVKPRDLQGILGLEISDNLKYPWARAMKRAMDYALVVASAPLWAPLALLLAATVALVDRGWPFYTQERMGHGGRAFRAVKFRTMVPRAEEALRGELERNPSLRGEWEQDFKVRNDPRITPLGRVLRRFSLDELPQFLNVLAGQMSLVGPRPLPTYHHAALPERERRLRERALPGVTGLWQVSGRSDSGTAGMTRWDSYYVRNWSVWLDLVILARTVAAVVSGRGAY